MHMWVEKMFCNQKNKLNAISLFETNQNMNFAMYAFVILT